MKKIGKILVALVLVVITAVLVSACAPNMRETTNVSNLVTSNGGNALKYGGYLYFINGSNTNDGTNNTQGKVVRGAIYRAKLDSNNEVILDDNGNITQTEVVVSNLVGYKNGSISIFGDYLYYATPNAGQNSKGTILYNQTCFYRYDLINKVTQRLYTTKLNDSSEEVSYAYYKQGTKLYLMVYEKTNKTLTSVEINSNVKTTVIASDVQTVLFSEHNGEVQDSSRNSFAENYIYFTRAALEEGGARTGVRVYKVLPDASNEKLISEGKSVSLLAIRSDKLLYSYDSKIYLSAISQQADTLSFETANLVSHYSYDNVVFVEDGDDVAVLFYESNNIRFVKLENGVVPDFNTENNRIVYTFDSSVTINFIATFTEKNSSNEDVYGVVYKKDSLLYRLVYKNLGTGEKDPKQLSSTTCDDANGNLIPEVIDGDIYFYSTSNSKTYLYKVTLDAPASNAVDENGDRISVKEATLVGIEG
ncbi:MAG: hypothetical protein IJT25_00445 [Clostridia bacterium]|nr:hypothetical protein [Clostridia bacterium]